MVLYPNFQWGEKVRFASPPADGHESEVAQKIGVAQKKVAQKIAQKLTYMQTIKFSLQHRVSEVQKILWRGVSEPLCFGIIAST